MTLEWFAALDSPTPAATTRRIAENSPTGPRTHLADHRSERRRVPSALRAACRGTLVTGGLVSLVRRRRPRQLPERRRREPAMLDGPLGLALAAHPDDVEAALPSTRPTMFVPRQGGPAETEPAGDDARLHAGVSSPGEMATISGSSTGGRVRAARATHSGRVALATTARRRESSPPARLTRCTSTRMSAPRSSTAPPTRPAPGQHTATQRLIRRHWHGCGCP